MNHWCLHRKHQEFAVVDTSKSEQASSANIGSEPSTLFAPLQHILSSQLAALAASLTCVFRFLAEKCGRSDRKKTQLQVARDLRVNLGCRARLRVLQALPSRIPLPFPRLLRSHPLAIPRGG